VISVAGWGGITNRRVISLFITAGGGGGWIEGNSFLKIAIGPPLSVVRAEGEEGGISELKNVPGPGSGKGNVFPGAVVVDESGGLGVGV
jgi:hypothetical protein